jgi:hypothetical protein
VCECVCVGTYRSAWAEPVALGTGSSPTLLSVLASSDTTVYDLTTTVWLDAHRELHLSAVIDALFVYGYPSSLASPFIAIRHLKTSPGSPPLH